MTLIHEIPYLSSDWVVTYVYITDNTNIFILYYVWFMENLQYILFICFSRFIIAWQYVLSIYFILLFMNICENTKCLYVFLNLTLQIVYPF